MCAYYMIMHVKTTHKIFKEMENMISRSAPIEDSDDDNDDNDNADDDGRQLLSIITRFWKSTHRSVRSNI